MGKPFTLMLVGRSGSGKTTIGARVCQVLKNRGVWADFIDGDVLRADLGNLFGYTRDERMKNSHVVRTLARYLNRNGVSAVITLVAPYREMREGFRAYLGTRYIEAYAACSYETCAKRDVKGYYARVQAGTMTNFNGADDVFEEPKDSEIVVDTEHDSVEGCVQKVISYLEEHDYGVPVHH